MGLGLSLTVTQSACKANEFGEITAKWGLLRRSVWFKVTDIDTNRKPICDFPLVINTNWHPISYRFEVIADYWSSFGHCVFNASPFRSLGATGNVHCSSSARWKARSGPPIRVNWTFSLGDTAEVLRANIGWKSTSLKGFGQFRPNFHVVGDG